MSETKIKDLRINKGLTKQQLIESTTITENDLSFVTDNSVVDVPAPTEVGKVLTSTEDGVEWAEGGSGGGLPDQTGHAGALLSTDGETASWVGKVSVTSENLPIVTIDPSGVVTSTSHRVAIAPLANVTTGVTCIGGYAEGWSSTAIGTMASSRGSYSIAIGYSASSDKDRSVAIGGMAYGLYSIQLGQGTNTEANTFSVGLSSTKNYKLLNADGTIPAERLANTIGNINALLDSINGEVA